MTAAQLAESLEVTARTVYRDVAALQGLRVPVEGSAGVGYVTRQGYDLPPLMFSAEELEAIVVALDLVRRARVSRPLSHTHPRRSRHPST